MSEMTCVGSGTKCVIYEMGVVILLGKENLCSISFLMQQLPATLTNSQHEVVVRVFINIEQFLPHCEHKLN